MKSKYVDVGEIRWNWDDIKMTPEGIARRIYEKQPNFFFGTATSAHQVEGNCTNNNWYEWEQQPGRIDNGDKSGAAAEHWTRYNSDFDLMKNVLGVKTYRFSIEWSKVEPQKGVFDQSVIKHYHEFIDSLLRRGIRPMITLQHFTNPIWFERLGAFEKEENVELFMEFVKVVFKEYSSKVDYWCTINEIIVQTTAGWLDTQFPPGNSNVQVFLEVVKNLLIAHTKIYRYIKAQPNGDKMKVGIVKSFQQHDPYNSWNPAQIALCNTANYLYNDMMLNYFKTGRLYFYVPLVGFIDYTNPDGINSNDFFGLNYYTHQILQVSFDIRRPFEVVFRDEFKHLTSDMGWEVYAEGFYRAIRTIGINFPNIPIIITENGLADKKDTFLRPTFMRRYLYALSVAISEGYNVQTYFLWSLMDNFEWAKGYRMRFGLFHVDYETQKRSLRRGAQFFVDVVKAYYSIRKKELKNN